MPRVTQLECTRSPKLTLKIQLSTAAHSLSQTELWSCNLKRSVKSGVSQDKTDNSVDVPKITQHVRGEAVLCSCPLTRVTISMGIPHLGAKKALHPYSYQLAFRH